MTIGRAVVGLAIGAASALTPLYIAEMSPAAWRGRLVTVSALFITAGQVVAYVIGWLLAQRLGGWRWMVGLGGVPAIVQVCALIYMPESPRWLMKVGKEEKAREVLGRIFPGESRVVEGLIGRMNIEIKEETEVLGVETEGLMKRMQRTVRELLNERPNRRALTIACMLQGAQQICGFVSIRDLISGIKI
jgi:SP family myo-inositol transporter-like MFS transporter 13